MNGQEHIAESDAPFPGLHPCADCGVELDADDLNTSCEECCEEERGVFGDPLIHHLLTRPLPPEVSDQ